MKIACPVSSPDEVEMLAENGAEEFYCGLTPEEWLSEHNIALWINRRTPRGANLLSYEALARLVEGAHRYRIPVFLTANAHYYTREQQALVLDLARRATEIGVNALIVSDPALILALREAGIDTPLHISSLGTCFNAETVGFYRDLGACRVILPRELSLDGIGRIVAKVRDLIECEAFILNDGCVFTEGFCLTTHSVGQAFCYRDWRYTFRSASGAKAQAESERLGEHYRDYREWIWYVNSCGCSVSHRGIQNGPCGLCAIKSLSDIGIASLKIVGREAPALRKLLSLRLVKAVVEAVRKGASHQAAAALSRALRDTPALCGSGYMCYYRTPAADGEREGRRSAPDAAPSRPLEAVRA